MSENDISINISKDKMEELQNLLEKINIEKRKYIENDTILKNLVMEITHETNSINSLLAQKVRDIVLRRDILDCLKINDDHESYLIDVNDFLNIELNYEEEQQLKTLLEEKLQQKEESLLKDINDISEIKVQNVNEIIEHFTFNPEEENNKIQISGNNLKETQNNIIKSTILLGQELNELVNLRNNVVPKAMENKTIHLMLENEKLNLRMKIIEIQSEVLFFKDSSMSMQAYKIAYKDMKERQEKYLKENNSIKSDLEKFKMVLRNQEFEEILQNYKQYVESIKKLKWLNNEVLKK